MIEVTDSSKNDLTESLIELAGYRECDGIREAGLGYVLTVMVLLVKEPNCVGRHRPVYIRRQGFFNSGTWCEDVTRVLAND